MYNYNAMLAILIQCWKNSLSKLTIAIYASSRILSS